MLNREMRSAADDLLYEILHCPIVTEHFRGSRSSCETIIKCQGVGGLQDFQVPEPWNGDVAHARLLFLSSNPSISEVEAYPRWGDPIASSADFFVHRFHGGQKAWVIDGKHSLRNDGSYGRAVPYWSEVQQRAAEIFGRPAVAGIDYALSEIVHCKSRQMVGVREAGDLCSALPPSPACGSQCQICGLWRLGRWALVD